GGEQCQSGRHVLHESAPSGRVRRDLAAVPVINLGTRANGVDGSACDHNVTALPLRPLVAFGALDAANLPRSSPRGPGEVFDADTLGAIRLAAPHVRVAAGTSAGRLRQVSHVLAASQPAEVMR